MHKIHQTYDVIIQENDELSQKLAEFVDVSNRIIEMICDITDRRVFVIYSLLGLLLSRDPNINTSYIDYLRSNYFVIAGDILAIGSVY